VKSLIRFAPMKRPARTSLALALTACAVGVSACGSGDDGTIPSSSSEDLLAALSDVESSFNSGACQTARNDASQFVLAVNTLPKEVGFEVKDSLRQAGENLVSLIETECQEPDEPSPAPPPSGATGEAGFEEDG
jgi:hypothetical protein